MKTTKALWTLFVLLAGTCSILQAAPSRQDLKSDWVEIRGGGLTGEVGGKPQLGLSLRNKAAQALWVQVRVAAPSPNAECTLTNPIAPGESAGYSCAQETIVPDTDYPIFVTVYRDEALTDQAEARQTVMRFAKSDADALASYLAAPQLPVTFNDVMTSEKLNLGTALFGGSLAAPGTLVVTQAALQYTVKKKVTEIPLAQIRSATIRQLGAAGDEMKTWVAVEYTEGDAIRTLGFQGSLFRGAGPRIGELDKAISYALSKFKSSAGDSAVPASDPH